MTSSLDGEMTGMGVKELLAFHSLFPVDKVLFEQLTPITWGVGPAVDGGGFYFPKPDVYQITNPIGKKAFITMMWSIDGINYYPNKPILYQPGNPIPAGEVGATVGCSIDDDYITFYSTHYIGAGVTYHVKYVLDSIE